MVSDLGGPWSPARVPPATWASPTTGRLADVPVVVTPWSWPPCVSQPCGCRPPLDVPPALVILLGEDWLRGQSPGPPFLAYGASGSVPVRPVCYRPFRPVLDHPGCLPGFRVSVYLGSRGRYPGPPFTAFSESGLVPVRPVCYGSFRPALDQPGCLPRFRVSVYFGVLKMCSEPLR